MHPYYPPTIIVAEDDRQTRALLVRQLERAGHKVCPCADGAEALDALKEIGGGILVADLYMPRMDGNQLCRSMRELVDLGVVGSTYFIMLTVQAAKDSVVEGLEAGADEYLTKPYHVEELLARIRVGQRLLAMQSELVARQVEEHRMNAQLAVLNERLEKLANTDGLTGLYNRRYTLERAEEAWALATRNNRCIGAIIGDIDRFKLFNDTYGHEVGDQVLMQVASTIRSASRVYDIVGRLGGEEFAIICQDATEAGLIAAAERVRGAVEALRMPVNDSILRVTISVGAALLSSRSPDLQSLLRRADTMLYSAKAAGRNQVWFDDSDPGRRVARVEDAPEVVRVGAATHVIRGR